MLVELVSFVYLRDNVEPRAPCSQTLLALASNISIANQRKLKGFSWVIFSSSRGSARGQVGPPPSVE